VDEAEATRWWATGVCCVAGAALAGPEWLPLSWTREDGPLEWTGFATFLAGSVLAFAAAWRLRPALRPAVAAAALGAVLLFAAGEEISWGQRVFEVDTPKALVDGNEQDELNLHNLAGLQHRAVVAQLAVAGMGLLLALRVRWARVAAPFFAGYLVYRATRGVAAIAGWGPAGRNSEAAEVMLGFGLLALTTALIVHVRRVPAPREAVARTAVTQDGRTVSRLRR
jgi:hypothetical protein